MKNRTGWTVNDNMLTVQSGKSGSLINTKQKTPALPQIFRMFEASMHCTFNAGWEHENLNVRSKQRPKNLVLLTPQMVDAPKQGYKWRYGLCQKWMQFSTWRRHSHYVMCREFWGGRLQLCRTQAQRAAKYSKIINATHSQEKSGETGERPSWCKE